MASCRYEKDITAGIIYHVDEDFNEAQLMKLVPQYAPAFFLSCGLINKTHEINVLELKMAPNRSFENFH